MLGAMDNRVSEEASVTDRSDRPMAFHINLYFLFLLILLHVLLLILHFDHVFTCIHLYNVLKGKIAPFLYTKNEF